MEKLLHDLTLTAAVDATAIDAEEFLQQCKTHAIEDGDDVAFWDRVQIFRVTVEAVDRALVRQAAQ